MSSALPETPPLPSGGQVELVCRDQRVVVTTAGAGLREFTVAGTPVIDGYDADAIGDGGRGQLLMPWPNRLRDGRYRVGDQELQLPLSEPDKGNAIHGLTRWMPWELVQRGEATAAFRLELPAQPGYPFQLRLDVVHRLDASGLTVSVSALNLGKQPAPFGSGAHPYLSAGAPAGEMTLHVPAASRFLTDERQIPTGRAPVEGTEFDFRRPHPIGATQLDLAYADLERDENGVAAVTLRGPSGEVRLWMDENHPYAMVFTGDTLSEDRRRRSVAVEPMTCAPNAFQTGDALRMIEPGERFVARWGIAHSLG